MTGPRLNPIAGTLVVIILTGTLLNATLLWLALTTPLTTPEGDDQ